MTEAASSSRSTTPRSEAAKALSEQLKRVAAQDPAALRAVYQATSAKLLGVVLRILSDRSESEDVLQEVYLTVWRRAGSYDPERSSPVTWLAAIARNRAIDRLRARGSAAGPLARSGPLDAGMAVADPSPSAYEALEDGEAARRLQQCMDELEPRTAAAIRTAFIEGVTYEVLAARMGTPLGTVKSWIRRGLLRLRGCLEP